MVSVLPISMGSLFVVKNRQLGGCVLSDTGNLCCNQQFYEQVVRIFMHVVECTYKHKQVNQSGMWLWVVLLLKVNSLLN
jgi:hypothetical protein